jgi:LysM repeat protein
MKPSFLSTRRRNTKQHPVTRSLRAVTSRRKKQRVAATASHHDFDYDDDPDSGSRIARVLTIIFFIHVVAIGLIFVHHYYLKRGLPALETTAEAAPAAPVAAANATTNAPPRTASGSAQRFSSGDAPYIVARGDNYTRIAAAHEVNEADLRAANDNAEIRPGLLLKIPPKRIVAVEPPEVAAIRNPALVVPVANPATDGLVAAIDPADRTQPEIPRATRVAEPGSGRTHTVQSGETIWRISQQYNVNQDALMKLNNITDPRRIRAGQQLQIP